MAETKRIPMLPVNHWWALRKKFQQSIPGVVSDSYLATVLEMEVKSARANVLPFLKIMGIIDEDGKPLERARLWRDDGHYPEVCKAILSEVYPKELLDAVPDPKANRERAQRWFANHTGAGINACNRMTRLYVVLVEADPSGEQDATRTSASRKTATKSTAASRPAGREKTERKSRATQSNAHQEKEARPNAPGININLQIHISADASPDQIEQIFEAMAKHIYRPQ